MQLNGERNLAHKVVLITGAAGILGQRFSEAFAACKAALALVDVDGDAAKRLADDLAGRYGTQAVGLACDISNPVSVDTTVSVVVEMLGGVDVLLNNAATKGSNVRAFFTAFEEYPIDVWREVMSVNVDGMFLMAQRVGRQMVAQGGGSIVQISSIYGLVGPDQRIYEGSHYLGGPINTPAVYSVSKAAVIGMTRYLATYWGEHKIRVNCIAPGGVESGQNSEFNKRYTARVPLGRMAEADEIAASVIFLASDDSSYITGQVLAVDGGLTAW